MARSAAFDQDDTATVVDRDLQARGLIGSDTDNESQKRRLVGDGNPLTSQPFFVTCDYVYQREAFVPIRRPTRLRRLDTRIAVDLDCPFAPSRACSVARAGRSRTS